MPQDQRRNLFFGTKSNTDKQPPSDWKNQIRNISGVEVEKAEGRSIRLWVSPEGLKALEKKLDEKDFKNCFYPPRDIVVREPSPGQLKPTGPRSSGRPGWKKVPKGRA